MNPQISILKSLRQLSPNRHCSFDEALGLAERQAAKLGHLVNTQFASYQVAGITAEQIASLPRMVVVYESLPVSGMSHWNGKAWIICLNKSDSEVRQRFTLLHEFKHIIDHGFARQLYTGNRRGTPSEQAERAADYFAGCALIPRTALKHAWGSGIQQPVALAEYFGVSEQAVCVRLDQTGLSRERDPEPEQRQATSRCQRPVWTPRFQAQRFVTSQPNYAGR